MPTFRNVDTSYIRRSRRLSNRPPPADPAFEDYNLDELELAYPNDRVPAHATQHISASPTDISSATGPSYDEDNDSDAAAFIPRPSHSRRRKEGHIPRPPNAFMLFRSELWSQGRIDERDHRQISRIAGSMWNTMLEVQKQPFKERAALVKKQHEELYPNYKYSPVYKANAGRRRTKTVVGAERTRNRQQITLLKGTASNPSKLIDTLDEERGPRALLQSGPERVARSRRTVHRESSPYTPSPRRGTGPPRSITKLPVHDHIDMRRSPAPEPASPEVKTEILATPQLAYPHVPNEQDSHYRNEGTMSLNATGHEDQIGPLERSRVTLMPSFYPSELLPAAASGGIATLPMLQQEELLPTLDLSPSPSSSSSLVSPSMGSLSKFEIDDFFLNPDSSNVKFNDPWIPAEYFALGYSDPFASDHYGSGEVSPTTTSPGFDDIFHQFLNVDYAAC